MCMKRLFLSMFLIGMLSLSTSYGRDKATDPVIQMKIEKLKEQEAKEIEKLKNKALKNSEKAHREADKKAQKESDRIRKE